MSASDMMAQDLPGFGLPLNHDNDQLFPNALNGKDMADGCLQLPLTTLREFTMLNIMNRLTDKPNWHKKVFDSAIVLKWKEEILSLTNMDVTEKMFDWCTAELQYKAKIFEQTGTVIVFNGNVVKSDSAIPASVKEALRAAVASLEQVPPKAKDWHPESDEQVLDLVHPSLFPLMYGRTRILPDSIVNLDDCIARIGEGETIPVPPEKDTMLAKQSFYAQGDYKNPFSRQFQWLPCNVSLSGQNEIKITSYINNLHPQSNKELYSIIERIIGHTIPLWNATLAGCKASRDDWARIDYSACEYDPDPENGPTEDGPQREEDEDEDNFDERRRQWIVATRKIVQPEPGFFEPPTITENIDLWTDFNKAGIQVIVKLANIHLTPEKPEYKGGSWHVEGQLNEHICASAIYYYDNHNITTSQLAFRQQSHTDFTIDYEQDDHDWLHEVFGCTQYGPAVQAVGAVDTPEDRLLTWPNILQHQVQSFKLADNTKPGHRKILALFLVDPNIRVISTANVPCQQREWWADALKEGASAISALPAELRDHVVAGVDDFPISLKEAKELRLKLMEERKKYQIQHGTVFETQHEFSLCEH